MNSYQFAVQILISAALLITFSTSSARAQLNLGGIKIPRVQLPKGVDIPKIPGISIPQFLTPSSLLNDKAAVTTSVQDAVGEVPFLDDYSPSNFFPLNYCRAGEQGSWILKPGLYGEDLQSYCLHAGTYGPSHGEGYIYGPLKGGRATIIKNILLNSADHLELPQHDVQSFIWAIEARVKFDKMAPNLKAVGQALLSSSDIFDLNGGTLALIPEREQEKLLKNADAAMRPILEAQNQIRSLATQVNVPFAEMEKYAVLEGDPPTNPNNREVPRGRWNYMPDGFFIRYIPAQYSRTHVDVYVPEQYSIKRDERGRIVRVAMDNCVLGITYQPEPIARNASGSLSAYGFDHVNVTTPDNTAAKLFRTTDYRNAGWTFVGRGTDDTLVENTSLSGMAVRVVAMNTLLGQLDSFETQFKDTHRGNWGSDKDIIDLASLRVGIKDAFASNPKFEPAQTHLLERAWQSAFNSWAKGASLQESQRPNNPQLINATVNLASYKIDADTSANSTPSQDIQIAGEVAVPVNTSRQRLGISPRPISPNGPYKLFIYTRGTRDSHGHAFIGLSDGQTTNYFGFYLQSNLIYGTTTGAQGIIQSDNPSDYGIVKEYTISKDGLAAAYQAIIDWNDEYRVTGHNCATFVATVAVASSAVPQDDFNQFWLITPTNLGTYLLSHGGTASGPDQ